MTKTILISCAAAEAIVNPVAAVCFQDPAERPAMRSRKIYETMKKLNITKIAVTSSNTGFGKAGKAQLEKLAPEYGIEIVV